MSFRTVWTRIRSALSRRRAIVCDTMYGTARIYRKPWGKRDIRVLDVDATLQSATYLDDGWCDLPFEYLRLFDRAFEARPQAHNLLMLGGGGFAYPKHVVAHLPQARIDVVEIDPAITRIAYDYFFLDRLTREWHTESTGRLQIFQMDALSYLRSCVRNDRRYDLIINDCFALDAADASLFAPDALHVIDICLVPDGLYLVNVITALAGDLASPLYRLVANLGMVFSYVYVIPCYREPADMRDNVVVVASQRPAVLTDALTLYQTVEKR